MTYYIDSNIPILHFIGDKKYGKSCEQILLRISKGEIQAVSSIHLLNEVYATIRMITRDEYKAKKLALKCLDFGIRFENLPPETLVKMKNSKLKLKWGDMIHYLTMKKIGVKKIITSDKHFGRIGGIEKIDPLGFPT